MSFRPRTSLPTFDLHGFTMRLIRLPLALCGLSLSVIMTIPQTKLVADSVTPGSPGRLLVANKGDQTLRIYDGISGQPIAVVAEGGPTGHEVAASLDGKKGFVPLYGTGGVGGPGTDGHLLRVIDIARGEVVGTVDFGRPTRPHCVKVGRKTGLVYVTTELLEAVAVIDPETLKIVASIPTGKPESHMLAITRDERRGYTVNVNSGTVSVLDLENKKLLTVIPVAENLQRISLSADEKRVFTADQHAPRIAVIDTEKNRVTTWIDLPSVGFGTTTTPDGKWLIVTLSTANKLAVVDLHSLKVVHLLDLPRSPQESLVRPDGGAIYVSCDFSRQVVEIDPQTWTIIRKLAAGPGADGLAWAVGENKD